MHKIQFGRRRMAPSKIVCVGRNYVAHIEELGNEVPEEMVVFIKPNSAITQTLLAMPDETVHYEAEICYLVEGGRFVGVGCGLDLTKRALQGRLKEKGLPWERAKAFDGAALFSPFVRLSSPMAELEIELQVNGQVRQHGSTTLMIYPPWQILAELSTFMTLADGDIVMSGTPAGVGPVVAGDHYLCRLLAAREELTSARWCAA